MTCSMSRKGICWDNASVERFFKSLKEEWVGNHLYQTSAEAINELREYLMIYYNTKRLYSILGYKTPVDFEKSA